MFNTCAVRENADNKLYGNLGHLAPVKAANPAMQIAVGGCLAQKDRATIVAKAPVGRRRLRHPQHRLPAGPARARPRRAGGAGRAARGARDVPVDAARPPRVGVRRVGERSASAATTPARSASSRACAARRRTAGPATSWPRSRRWSPRASSRSRCSGQNVNSYGVEFGDRLAFGKLLRAVRRGRRASSGCASPARTPRTSPTTSSPRWPRPRT